MFKWGKPKAKVQIHIMRCGDDFEFIIMRKHQFNSMLEELTDRQIPYNINNYIDKSSFMPPKEE